MRSSPGGSASEPPASRIVCLARLILPQRGRPQPHRRLRHQEGGRDLPGGETTDGAQGEGDPAGRGELGVTAEEQQGQRVVPVRAGLLVGGVREEFRGRRGQGQGVLAAAARGLAAHLVDEPAGGDGDQPAPRVVGDALLGPLAGRRDQGLLDGVLAGVEGPVPPHEDAEDLWRVRAQQVLDPAGAGHTSAADSCRTGQSSTGSTSAKGMSAAISLARSGPSQSSR